LLKQRSIQKGVDHYAILDIGNRLHSDWNRGGRRVIVYQSPPILRADWAEATGDWEIVGHVVDEADARARMAMAAATQAMTFSVTTASISHALCT
jgi:hypothetical protein